MPQNNVLFPHQEMMGLDLALPREIIRREVTRQYLLKVSCQKELQSKKDSYVVEIKLQRYVLFSVRAFYGPAWKTRFRVGQTRVSALVQFLLSLGQKTLITLGDSRSPWTAVVYLNLLVFRTVLDRLFSSRLALALELYGSFGICSYSKFQFCGLNE